MAAAAITLPRGSRTPRKSKMHVPVMNVGFILTTCERWQWKQDRTASNLSSPRVSFCVCHLPFCPSTYWRPCFVWLACHCVLLGKKKKKNYSKYFLFSFRDVPMASGFWLCLAVCHVLRVNLCDMHLESQLTHCHRCCCDLPVVIGSSLP